jgi:uncharacterized damage-inducible protein DinB
MSTISIKDQLVGEFAGEMAATRKALERVPTDKEKLDWKPHAKSKSMGELAAHIAGTPKWIILALTEDSFDVAKVGDFEKDETDKDILASLDRLVAKAKPLLDAMTEEQLAEPWKLMRGGELIREFKRYDMIRAFGLNHCIHHRGQLTVYLRLNEIPVPGMYGGSADER